MSGSNGEKGFTLVETIVGLMVCLILMAVAFAVISPIGDIFGRSSQKSDAQQIAASILESIRAETSRSTELSASANEVICDGNFFAVNGDGYLISGSTDAPDDAQLVYDTSFYNGKTISMTSSEEDTNKVEVTIDVTGSGGNNDDPLYTVTAMLSTMFSDSTAEGYSASDLVSVTSEPGSSLSDADKKTAMGNDARILYYLFKPYIDGLNTEYPGIKVTSYIGFAYYTDSQGNIKQSGNKVYYTDSNNDRQTIYISSDLIDLYKDSGLTLSNSRMVFSNDAAGGTNVLSIDYIAVKDGDYWGKYSCDDIMDCGSQTDDGWSPGVRPE